MQLDFIDLGTIDPALICSLSEIPTLWALANPTIIEARPSKQAIVTGGHHPLDKYKILENVPENVTLCRQFFDYKYRNGDWILDPDNVTLHICYPSSVTDYLGFIKSRLVEAMQTSNVTLQSTEASASALDVSHDGTTGRVVQIAAPKPVGAWGYALLNIMLYSRIDLLKITLKPIEFSGICYAGFVDWDTAYHEGLAIAYPSLSRATVIQEVVNAFVNAFGLTLVERSITAEENSAIVDVTERKNVSDFLETGLHPDRPPFESKLNYTHW